MMKESVMNKTFRQFLREADLGAVEPGLDKGDNGEPYNQPVVNNYDEESQIQLKKDQE